VLEPAVVSGTTPAAVLIGVHSAGSTPEEDTRAREYLPGLDPLLLEAHSRFLLEELSEWAQRELGVSGDRERRAMGGFSNGAVLASALGCRHPDRFGSVIAFSLGLLPPLPRGVRPSRHYLLAGTLEPGFHRSTRAWGPAAARPRGGG
jgi:enterochelin esterase-like enzyme